MRAHTLIHAYSYISLLFRHSKMAASSPEGARGCVSASVASCQEEEGAGAKNTSRVSDREDHAKSEWRRKLKICLLYAISECAAVFVYSVVFAAVASGQEEERLVQKKYIL